MRGKVLIVEDEPIVALDLKQELEMLGCEVLGVAESADEALVAAGVHRPDLALMDVRIVGSVDGIQTAGLLRAAYQIPVVFLTSYSDETTIARAAREMPYGYLTKPFQSGELKATLQHHMGELEKETESIRDITRSFNNDIYTNYYDSRSYNSHGYGSPSWEPGSNSSASQPAVSQPAIESSTTGASAIQGALSGSPVEANEGQLAVNGTVPRGLPAPVEPAARTEEQDSHSSAASPVES